MKPIRLKGPGLNDFFASEMVRTQGAEKARSRCCGEMLAAVERVILAQQLGGVAAADGGVRDGSNRTTSGAGLISIPCR